MLVYQPVLSKVVEASCSRKQRRSLETAQYKFRQATHNSEWVFVNIGILSTAEKSQNFYKTVQKSGYSKFKVDLFYAEYREADNFNSFHLYGSNVKL